MSLTKQIIDFGMGIGLDIVRITNADPFPRAENALLESIERGYIPKSEYGNKKNDLYGQNQINLKKINRRCNPRNILKNAKSIISVAQCYLIEEDNDFKKNGQPCGIISKYDIANFYYEVRTKLKKISDFINQETDFKHKSKNKSCYVSLVEKPIAQRAGVGWYGKNGIILTEKFGSWIVLGELITELELEPDQPLQKNCGDCKICMDSCPTKAIVAPYIIDRTKCLQYISEQLMDLPLEYREIWGDKLYGCSICQDVCPWNKDVKPKKYRPEHGFIGSRIPLIPLLEMSEKAFEYYFRDNQIAMRPRDAIIRNAVLALGNSKDPVAVLPLIKVLREYNHPTVRGHAAWALGRLGGKKSKIALEKTLKTEENGKVKNEILNALNQFELKKR